MLRSSSRLLFAVAAFACAGILNACADESDASAVDRPGLLGRTHFSGMYDYYQLANPGPFESSGSGVTFVASLRTTRWLDLAVVHARGRVDGPVNFDLEREETLGLLTTHTAVTEHHRGFLRAGYGIVTEEVVTRYRGRAWQLGAGFEFQVSPSLALTPSVDLVQSRDLDMVEWRFGLTANWQVSRHWAVTLRARHASVREETDYQQYSIGLSAVL